jgi:hypothetical protein
MTTTEAGSPAGPASNMPELPDDVQLWLVRHGETEWSAAGRHTGVTDLPLTEAGERQARALAPMLADIGPALVLSSPRQRARDTALLAGLAIDELTEDLAEWNYGSYEGRTTHDIRAERPGWSIWTRRSGPAPTGYCAGQRPHCSTVRSSSSDTGTSAACSGRAGWVCRSPAAHTCCWVQPHHRCSARSTARRRSYGGTCPTRRRSRYRR